MNCEAGQASVSKSALKARVQLDIVRGAGIERGYIPKKTGFRTFDASTPALVVSEAHFTGKLEKPFLWSGAFLARRIFLS